MPPKDDPSFSYFPQTGHNLGQGFREFWLRNDGLRLFGYPITEEFQENNTTVQYFERVRLEVVPNPAGGPGRVGIGLLGREMTQGRYFVTSRFFVGDAGRAYFGATQHSLGGAFYGTWKERGGLAIFGYPISEEIRENNLTVQYFERARMEFHPEFTGTDLAVGLGQLGVEALRQRGWIP